MPSVRKLSPEELQEIIEQERREDLAAQAFGPPIAPPAPDADDRLELLVVPRIGEVIRFREPCGESTGVVLRFAGSGDAWTALQVLVNGQRRWITHGTILYSLGRPRGISRIDHPARRTYGWYVRLYERGIPRLARLFSDGQYQGISAALEAALAFHALSEEKRPVSSAPDELA